MTNQEIVELYDQGWTYAQIAQRAGLSATTAWLKLRRAPAKTRPPRPKSTPRPTLKAGEPLSDWDLLKLHDQGWTYAEIGEVIGRSRTTVNQRILRATPPRAEVIDAIARWGINGCAEEYEVTPATVERWQTTLDPRRDR